ncbi:ABC transporter permease [Sediminispirochaeta bajacaliforniensis]|uniref:ABC transporter permease n=1 Tax=Sediminispirochaeta bajacaliforniensis TaxID=148 RepID=UPI00037EEE39|nr:FtsX-like permease family protein [Sediminispirochaeta bajacaliforniensis]
MENVMDKELRGQGDFLTLSTIAYRNIWRNGRRTILCIIAVAVAVFFNIFMQAWISGMIEGIEEAVRTYETGHVNVVSNLFEEEREYYPVQYPIADGKSATELSAEIEALPGVKAALPRITTYASLFDSTVKHALLWGIDIQRERAVNVFNLTDRDDGLIEGRFPRAGSNECAVGLEFARKAGVKIGDPIPLKTVSAQFSDKYWRPVITGIFAFDYRKFDEEVILVPIDRLQRILVLGEATQQMFIYAENADDALRLRDEVAKMLGPGQTVREWGDNYWVAYMRQTSFLYVIVFLVFQIVASFLIINTVLMIIHERIKEIGMMGALGMTRREIVTVFFLEAVFLSVLGSAVGMFFGGLVTWIGSLFPLDMDTFTGGGMKEFPVSGTIFITFSPKILMEGFVFGILVSSLCTLIPSLKSAFIEPVEALRR